MLRQIAIKPVLVAAALAVVWGFFTFTPLARSLEHRQALGFLFALRGPVPPPPGAVIVGIDTASLAWLSDIASGVIDGSKAFAGCAVPSGFAALGRLRGPGGLPRWLQACLVTRLEALGTPAIVFDVLFATPGDPVEDALLARALRSHGRTAILVGFGRTRMDGGAAALIVDRKIEPLRLFADSAAARGTYLMSRTRAPVYGYWRTVPGFPEVPSLPEEAARLMRSPMLPGGGQPAGSFAYIWHYGPAGTIPHVLMRDVLAGAIVEPLRTTLSRSAVFVGASDPAAANYPDTFPSFFSNRLGDEVSGVEMAATAYLNLTSGRILRALPPAGQGALVVCFVFVVCGLVLLRVRAALLGVVLLVAAYVAGAVLFFSREQIMLPVAVPVFAGVPLVLVVTLLNRYRLARALTMRLAPAPMARRMLARSTDRRSELKTEDASVVFCDLIGSSFIAETLSEVAFSGLLETYYDTLSGEITRCDGFVSSFSGDGVVAVFGSASAPSEHARSACRSMVAAIRAIHRTNADNAARGLPPLRLRVGINSGRVAEGEVGARNRYNFSVVGDVVNLASRLEQLGKTLFPGESDVILIGAATRQLIGDMGLAIADCGLQAIPGRKAEEHVYRIMPYE